MKMVLAFKIEKILMTIMCRKWVVIKVFRPEPDRVNWEQD